MSCVVKKEVILIPKDGPYVLGEDVYSIVGVETSPGVIEWSTEKVKISKGLTVMFYDWSRKVQK
jgi:hypothetical protein